VTYYTNDAQKATGNLSKSYAYDALGNEISVTDALGNSTYTYYDILGRVRAVASGTGDATGRIALTEFNRDTFGQVLSQRQLSLGASSANQNGYTAFTAADDRVVTNQYNRQGQLIATQDANQHWRYFSYNEAGKVAREWQSVTDASGGVQVVDTRYTYDEVGQLTLTQVLQGRTADEAVSTAISYNGFGEVTVKTVNGNIIEKNDYDNAGRAWRTSGVDGVAKVHLFDQAGRETAVLSSDGTKDLNSFTNVASAAQQSGLMITSMAYDRLGRVITQTQPQKSAGLGSVQLAKPRLTVDYPLSDNKIIVNLKGTNFGLLGATDIRIDMSLTALNNAGDGSFSASFVGSGKTFDQSGFRYEIAKKPKSSSRYNEERDGVQEEPDALEVTQIVIFKRDIHGVWQQIAMGVPDYNGQINFQSLQVSNSTDTSNQVKFQIYRKDPATKAYSWQDEPTMEGGDAQWLDPSALATGSYDYRVISRNTNNTLNPFTEISRGTLTIDANKQATLNPLQNGGQSVATPKTNIEYDRWGNQISVSDARSPDWITRYTYNVNNQLVSTTQQSFVDANNVRKDVKTSPATTPWAGWS
jgi:YD repeat-containing protein